MIDLRLGHTLEQLREIPDGTANCIVTSPPYWGLRAYGTDPQVWLNGHEPCAAHEWTDTGIKLTVGKNINIRGKNEIPWRDSFWKKASNNGDQHKVDSGNACSLCGAWRGELGLEPTPELYVEHLTQIFREARRVLRDDGVAWINLGDSYASGKGTCFNPGGGENSLGKDHKDIHPLDRGNKSTLAAMGLKPKDLIGIPWRVAFALQADGWYLRQDIIWAKPNPMPESVRDRCTKAHEYVFLMSKSPRYFYDADAVREEVKPTSGMNMRTPKCGDFRPTDGYQHATTKTYETIKGANRRSVWTVTTHPFKEAHFATFPPKLIEPMILAGCPVGGTVLDPFNGSGTTGLVAVQLGRNYIGIELKPEYVEMTKRRLESVQMKQYGGQ